MSVYVRHTSLMVYWFVPVQIDDMHRAATVVQVSSVCVYSVYMYFTPFTMHEVIHVHVCYKNISGEWKSLWLFLFITIHVHVVRFFGCVAVLI